MAEILGKAVGADKTAPAVQTGIINRLMRTRHVPDIVVAWHGKHRDIEFAEQSHGEDHVVFLIGAIDGQITGVHDKVGLHLFYPAADRFPIAIEMWLGRAEMRVTDLDDFHRLAPCRRSVSGRIGSEPALWAMSLDGQRVSDVREFSALFQFCHQFFKSGLVI
jgi:hypothetical protein